jgi:two-component system nitrate/nitrite response regulator NarL
MGHELGRFLERRRGQVERRGLTARELEILRHAADGKRGPEIARQLVISPSTVKTHFENIYEKLGVCDRAAAVAQALRAGLIA